jgi:transposase
LPSCLDQSRAVLDRGGRERGPGPDQADGRREAFVAIQGKSDPIDAAAVAHAAIAHPDLPAARLDGDERELRLLVDHRECLVRTRTRFQSKLRWLLHAIDPDIAVPLGALDRKVHMDRLEARLAGLAASAEVRIARSLLRSCRVLTGEVDALQREIAGLMRSVCPELLVLTGCGELTGAKLLGEIAGIARFSTEAKLALHAGVAPLEASSGQRHRHRVNRSGNRQLNAALHRIALTQKRMHPPAIAYIERKRAEGKTEREATRCLKRQILRVVFHILKDAERKRRSEEAERVARHLAAVA